MLAQTARHGTQRAWLTTQQLRNGQQHIGNRDTAQSQLADNRAQAVQFWQQVADAEVALDIQAMARQNIEVVRRYAQRFGS